MPRPTQRDAADSARLDVRVDMSGLDDTIGFTLKRAQIAVSRDIHAIFNDFDITAVQFSVLTVASNNPGITQADLAAALEVERPRIVPVLDTLERRSLAERRQDAVDGRSRRIHLTKAGVAILGELTSRLQQLEDRLTAHLGTRGRDDLLGALRMLIDRPR